jgi:hypothetical protein
MVNEKEIVNETSPDEVWEAVDHETRESVINMFLHLAFKLLISEAEQVQTNDEASNQMRNVIDNAN